MRIALIHFLWIGFFIIGCKSRLSSNPPITPTKRTRPVDLSDEKFSPTSSFQMSSHAPLPSLFSIKSKWIFSRREKIFIHFRTKVFGNINMRVYKIHNPMETLMQIKDFKNVFVSKGIRKALGDCENQTKDYLLKDIDGIPIGEYSLIRNLDFHISGHFGYEAREQFAISSLPQGFYLLEARLGPQIAYLPICISDLRIWKLTIQDQLFLLAVNIKTGQLYEKFPDYYLQDGKSWIHRTNRKQIEKISRIGKEKWLFIRNSSLFYADILSPKPQNLWCDRNFYCVGDEVIVLGKFQQKTPKLFLLDENGKEVTHCQVRKKNQLGVGILKLPLTLSSGEYLLKMGKKFHCIAISHLSRQENFQISRMELKDRIFQENSIVEVKLYEPHRKAQIMSLWKKDSKGKYQLVDKQNRLLENGMGEYFFQVSHYGQYQLRAEESQENFYVYHPKILLGHTWLTERLKTNSKVSLLVPGKNVSQWVVLQQGSTFVDQKILPAFSGNRLLTFSLPKQRRFSFHNFYLEQGQVQEEIWYAPDFSKKLEITVAKKSNQIHIQSTSREKIKASFVHLSRKNKQSPRFYKRSVGIATFAKAFTSPILYKAWSNTRLSVLYHEAQRAFREKKYSLALEKCLKILKISPGHRETMNLQFLILQKIKFAESKSSLLIDPKVEDRLQKKIYLSQASYDLESLLDSISRQTEIPIEIHPLAFSKRSNRINRIPRKGSAIILLKYALASCALTYKIEYSTIYIFHSSMDPKKVRLSMLDSKLKKDPKPQKKNGVYFFGNSDKIQVTLPRDSTWMMQIFTLDAKGNVWSVYQKISN